MSEYDTLDATAIAEEVRAGARPETIQRHFSHRAKSLEPKVHAFASFDAELVDRQINYLRDSGNRGPLLGIPVGVKDIFDTADYPTEFFSPIYERNRPSRDAHVVTLLRQAGAIIMGKTHTTEFAFMHTGPTRNPHDLLRTPGSSSAGSAAGVAAGLFPLALGTQTAGSLIKPASYCGVYAFKPSLGLVSLEGVKPLAPSFDTVGWFGRSVRDLNLLARILVPGFPSCENNSGQKRIGFFRTSWWDAVDSDVARSLDEAVDRLRCVGHIIEEVVLPAEFQTVAADHQLINDCEGRRSLIKEYQAHRLKLSPETLAMIARASATTWNDETAAVARLRDLAPILDVILQPFDAIISASCGMVAPIGLTATGPSDFIKLWTAFGLPQVNIPLAQKTGELPVGLQLIGMSRRDSSLLKMAEQVAETLGLIWIPCKL